MCICICAYVHITSSVLHIPCSHRLVSLVICLAHSGPALFCRFLLAVSEPRSSSLSPSLSPVTLASAGDLLVFIRRHRNSKTRTWSQRLNAASAPSVNYNFTGQTFDYTHNFVHIVSACAELQINTLTCVCSHELISFFCFFFFFLTVTQ